MGLRFCKFYYFDLLIVAFVGCAASHFVRIEKKDGGVSKENSRMRIQGFTIGTNKIMIDTRFLKVDKYYAKLGWVWFIMNQGFSYFEFSSS